MQLIRRNEATAIQLIAIVVTLVLPVLPVASALAADVAAEAGASRASVSETDNRLTRGQAIYSERCADCHGDRGQGVEGAYGEPLIGDDSIGELSIRISETMPEDEPQLCVGEDADAVAAYVHHAFYSEAARIRNRPPRITLTHLTSNQLRQSLADLYAHVSGSMKPETAQGLEASYFNGSRFKRSSRKIERLDATIDFDWMRDGPGEGLDPADFSVRWRGGLSIDETGRYEIVIRSTCAFGLQLGRRGKEFVDNRVQSGNKTEFRKSIVLTSGHVVPIQIELFQRKRKTEQPPARISLAWIRPNGVEQIIPRRHLVPKAPPGTFLLQTKLPPDDRSYGYDRGLAVDRQWDESTTAAAVEFSQAAVDELWPDYRRKHRKGDDDGRAQLRRFLHELAVTAFRGPLDEPAQRFYLDDQIAAVKDDTEAIKRAVLLLLKSPRFLYPELDSDRSESQRRANRLALTLFDSLPSDKWLVRLAREGKLQTTEQVRAAAKRMVSDLRTRGKTHELMYAWLNLSHVDEITKSGTSYPEFDAHVVADLRASLDAFLDEVVWGESSDFRQLFLADWVCTTPTLEAFYGDAWKPTTSAETGLTRTRSSSNQQHGLLTHPYLMSRLAYQDSTSPIHRGVFLIRYTLGRTLRPPQEAFTPLSPDLHPDMTTRQRVALQTSPQNCQVCHHKINGLGFALENYDAVGRFRDAEGGKPIDSTGHYTTRAGKIVAFHGASELARFLANSDDAQRAFVNRAFQHFVKQPVAAYGSDRLNDLTQRFRNDNFHIRRLLVEIAVIAAAPPNQASTRSLEQ